ncbi:hypothetical protein P280DRAFT_376641, partial [Massarina eburnea CBS 473.64]
HSQTVRGTFSNPKTDTTSNPPQLGDPTSLEREKSDSASPTGNNTGDESSASSDSSSPGNKSQQKEPQLPHPKSVRGTLANASGPRVNKSMLGDPVSLKAETSDSGFDLGADSDKKEQEEM